MAEICHLRGNPVGDRTPNREELCYKPNASGLESHVNQVLLGVADIFYRIVRNERPTADDFRTARDDGLPLFNEKHYREWAEGISVYDDIGFTISRARKNKTGLGRYVATIVVPEGANIEVAKTLRDPRHYTIYASGDQILEFVHGATIKAREQDDF